MGGRPDLPRGPAGDHGHRWGTYKGIAISEQNRHYELRPFTADRRDEGEIRDRAPFHHEPQGLRAQGQIRRNDEPHQQK